MVKKTLHRKLFRDMWRNRMQFVAMILLCALGTWVFSGLDAAWRMLDFSMKRYFAEQRMTDFWVHKAPMDQEAQTKIQNTPGVLEVQTRATFEAEVDLPHEPTLQVHAYEEAIRLNVPILLAGEALENHDLRGCLLENQFAQANGISVGDRLRIRLNGMEVEFVVRGLCISPEHIITANDVRPTPHDFGFMVCNSGAVPFVPLNEALVSLTDQAAETETRALLEAEFPEALLISHKGHMSTNNLMTDIQMFRDISYLFPLLAFAVAALIVLTTLTRMIENQRMQMGTLKALGYGDREIRRHYLCYAIYPSAFGALLGLITGRESLPYLLWQMEADTFVMPYRLQAYVSWEQWAVCVLAVLLCLFICLHTYRKNANEETAALLRPKPPKAGRKLLLEYIPSLWKKLGFNGKMVTRNLFRNRLRTLMSFVGVLCCTMLLITSLGLQDSVQYFVKLYFEGTIRYSARANLTEEAGRAESYQKRIDAERVEPIMERSITLAAGGQTKTTLLTVMEADQQLLYIGKNESYLPLPEQGIAISRKLCDTMGISVGDAVKVFLPGDNEPFTAIVSVICDVNIGQGLYMAREEWGRFRKSEFTPTALLLKNPTEAALQKLEDMEEVDSIKYPKIQQEQQLAILKSLTGIFSLMSAAALGLAFVVLYNMGILNFMERYREYATLKVLGYHQKEIRGLMRRENDIIALLGVLCGLWPGRWLTALILRTCEGDNIVFASTVEWHSYVISGVVTFLFSAFVTWLLTRKVKGIDMVEALKSVE